MLLLPGATLSGIVAFLPAVEAFPTAYELVVGWHDLVPRLLWCSIPNVHAGDFDFERFCWFQWWLFDFEDLVQGFSEFLVMLLP